MSPLDLQVNGYAGTDFNSDDLTAEALHHACECLREDGCAQILATFITDTIENLESRMGRLAALRDRLAQGLLTSPLYDTDLFRKSIETAYLHMMEIARQGQPPQSFAV